jgi:hypothetical protein
MFYLYLKKHNTTGLKYLGYTKNDPLKYKGSGLYWKRHINQYGYNVTTEILFKSENINEISKMGKYYSNLWDIVNNKEFANLCEEDGNKAHGAANPNFIGHPQSIETKLKISQNNGRGNLGKFGKEHPAYGHKLNKNHYDNLEKARESLKGQDVWNKGKKGVQLHSDNTKKKMSESANKLPKEIVECPVCKKLGGKPAMKRFHFDKCKGI